MKAAVGWTRSFGMAGESGERCQQGFVLSTESTCQVVPETRVPDHSLGTVTGVMGMEHLEPEGSRIRRQRTR
jgi:hypothetical protein